MNNEDILKRIAEEKKQYEYLQDLPTEVLRDFNRQLDNLISVYGRFPKYTPRFVFDMMYHQREIYNIIQRRIDEKLAEGF